MKHHEITDGLVEISRIKPYSVFGETGLLLEEPRSATVKAAESSLVLKFDKSLFNYMFEKIPAFGQTVGRTLAARLNRLSKNVPLPQYDKKSDRSTSEVIEMLPMDFIVRHRVLPLEIEENILCLGFTDDPEPKILESAHQFLPSMEIRAVHIDIELFNEVVQSHAGIKEIASQPETPEEAGEIEVQAEGKCPQLDKLLSRMVGEGVSDLHLSARHAPHWRIDGEMYEIADTKKFDPEEVLEWINPAVPELNREEFSKENDTDFVYPLPGVARFRVNLFRDENGVGAVLRLIPSKILSFEQLGLPPVLAKLCELPKGLVLVTGPTGSGKSTTLAAMIDYINHKNRVHILTMEDPIEFVHKSDLALVNQREIRRHTASFHKALRAALREDPDIVLLGEMRDLETIALALETANTGHLVFGTLHTSTAISTIDRIIDVFPPDQQNQIRIGLGESLKGVISQTLCKRIGGGRIAALEVLVLSTAVANMIRENKNKQIYSAMQTGKAEGNMVLNEELAKLVEQSKVEFDEAIRKTTDKADLAKRLGREVPKL